VTKLYYGNGTVTIEGSDIRLVQISYRGAIRIEDKTSDAFGINYSENSIAIVPYKKGFLNELFNYVGEFKILSIDVINSNAEKVPATIHRVMDYTELLNTKSEDMTIKSEDLSSTHVSGSRVSKTSIDKQYRENLHTSEAGMPMYFNTGEEYSGYYHTKIKDATRCVGRTHNDGSRALYYKQTDSDKLIKIGTRFIDTPKYKNQRKKRLAGNKTKRRIR